VVRTPEFGPVEKALRDKRKKTGMLCAALIDPEDYSIAQATAVAKTAQRAGVSAIMVGGSTIGDQSYLDAVVKEIKRTVTIPVILFPGNITGVSRYADAILFSCLLNSSNPYFIIGAQALGAIQVHRSHLEAIPMGYLVFGSSSTTSFIGQANGIPLERPNLAVMYALAAQFLGMRTLYLEAGSGASQPIPPEAIGAVRSHYKGFLIIGGGITSLEHAKTAAKSGADMIVMGNLLGRKSFEPILRKIISGIRT
jgi:phosphoglycerol geranylgeranyltransferase